MYGQPATSRTNFKFNHHLGDGSYSTVLHCTELDTSKNYAVKVVSKKQILRENKVQFVLREKAILTRLDHHYIIKLHSTFQDSSNLYYVLELAKTDLHSYFQRVEIRADFCRFYVGEIVCGLGYLHDNGIIHRDLKPENVLIDHEYHIKLADFGTAKDLTTTTTSTTPVLDKAPPKNSFVGTAQFCPPELLNDRSVSFASDIWSLGCIIYLLSTRLYPFSGANDYLTFKKIQKLEYVVPESVDTHTASLVTQIFVVESVDRPLLGDIRKHAFFEGFDFLDLHLQTPPVGILLPGLGSDGDNEDCSSDVEFEVSLLLTSACSFPALEMILQQS